MYRYIKFCHFLVIVRISGVNHFLFLTKILTAESLCKPVICTEFSDVPNDYYATGYIKSLYDENIVSGYEDGTFKPDNSLTRAEAVTMMNKVLGNPIAENAENP